MCFIRKVCVACIKLGHSSYLPCLRPCLRCLEHNQEYIKRVFLAAIANCEEGNKATFRSVKDEVEQNRINPEFALLTPIPDVAPVGKTLTAGFSNWYLKLGNERSNIEKLEKQINIKSTNRN